MRIRIRFPEPPRFTHRLVVRVSDLNYGRHLGHDNLVSLLHETRVQFLHSIGASELDTEGLVMVVSDLAVRYLSEAFLGDRLEIDVNIGDSTGKSCDLHYRVRSLSTDEVVATAKTGLVFLKPEGGVARLPAVIRRVAEASAQLVRGLG